MLLRNTIFLSNDSLGFVLVGSPIFVKDPNGATHKTAAQSLVDNSSGARSISWCRRIHSLNTCSAVWKGLGQGAWRPYQTQMEYILSMWR